MEGNIDVLRHVIHYSFHLLMPFVFGWLFWKENWWKAGFIMVSTVLIDLDHLVADPMFDASRCSLGFHGHYMHDVAKVHLRRRKWESRLK